MAWQLKVWASGVSPLTAPAYTYSNTAPGGIQDGFQFELEPSGNCVQMTFEGIAAQLNITATNTVQLLINGVPMFYGYVSAAPSSTDKFRKAFSVLGYKDRLRKVPTIQVKRTAITDISILIADYSVWFGDAVVYDAANVQTGLGSIQNWSYSFAPLGQVLDRIAAIANVKIEWGVNAEGKFFFRVPSSASPINIAYPISNLERTAVLEDSVVSSVIIPIRVDNPSLEFTRAAPFNITTSFVGDPIHYQKNSISDLVYQRAKIIELGDLNPFNKIIAYSTVTQTNYNNTANLSDLNPLTFASNIGGGGANIIMSTILPDALGVIAFEIAYSTDDATMGADTVVIGGQFLNSSSIVHTAVYVNLPRTGTHNAINKVRIILQPLSTSPIDKAQFLLTMGTSTTSGSVQVYEMVQINANPNLSNIADQYLRDPQPTAARVKPNLILAPTPTVTISGAPGGTITAPATKYTYNFSNDEVSTVIDLGNRVDDPTARALRNAASITDAQNRADTRKLGGF